MLSVAPVYMYTIYSYRCIPAIYPSLDQDTYLSLSIIHLIQGVNSQPKFAQL